MLTFNKYERPGSLEEAWTLNKKKSARLAAGTMWMRMGNGQIGTLIDLCGLGLDQIEETEDAFHIGAMVPLRRLERCGERGSSPHCRRSVPQRRDCRRKHLGEIWLFGRDHTVSGDGDDRRTLLRTGRRNQDHDTR